MIEIHLDGYEIEELTYDNLEKLEIFITQEDEYFSLTEGDDVPVDDVDDIPEDNIYNMVFCRGGEPMAFLSMTEYPETNLLWLDFFIVQNKYKRQSVGTKCINALINSLEGTIFKRIRLHEHADNAGGIAFWKHIGFSVLEENELKTHKELLMEYVI